MFSELTVIVKNEEKSQITKHLIYNSYMVDENDDIIQEHVANAIKEFNADPDDIRVKISMEIR